MNYLAPLTLLAVLISTLLIFTPTTAHAGANDKMIRSATDLPLLNNPTPVKLAEISTPPNRPEGQVVNNNLAFSYENRPALTAMTKSTPTEIEFISLPHITFGHNGIKLTPQATDLLNGAAQFFFENDSTIKRILIQGHSNSIADKHYNYRLSDSRAYAVWDYLAGKGVPGDIMVVYGMGDTRPVDENWTRAGRQRNRHVEIQIVKIK